MIKVIEAISDGNIGGAGVLLCSRLKNSDTSRIKTTVVIPKGSKLIKRLEETDAEIREVDCRSDVTLDINAASKLISVIKEIDPDIINTHGWLSARIAAALCKTELRIYTRHCAFPISNKQKNFISRKIFQLSTDCLSHHIIAVADVAKDNLIEMGADGEKISVIINGTDGLRSIEAEECKRLKNLLGIDEKAIVLGINARLESYKGHDCLLEALSIFVNKYSEEITLKCLIIGEGSRREALEKSVRDKKLKDVVIFTGFVSDVSPYMNIVDINVNCSTGTETSSLALSEGMSLGIPAIVSDFGGNPYMVRNGENGFIFKQNDPEMLAERIFLLANDKDLYTQMSKAAKNRYLNELNAKSMTDKIEKLYFDLLTSARANRKKAIH